MRAKYNRTSGAAALVVMVLCATSPAARAQVVGESDCQEGLRGLSCSTVQVPLDRSGAVSGTLDLRVVRNPRTRSRPKTLVFLAGGPGDSATFAAARLLPLLERLAPEHQAVVFDQRGTGEGALRCPELEQRSFSIFERPASGAVEACAQALGARAGLFSSADSVADLEAVRQAIGAGPIAIAGVSYGTYVAGRYARAYPGNTERLVLDSTVPQTAPDPFLRSVLRQIPRTLSAFCAGGSCRGTTRDPMADLRRLLARLERNGIAGPVHVGERRPVRVELRDARAFAELAAGAGGSTQVLASLPAAVRSALDGDPAPLTRLYALVTRGGPVRPAANSTGLFVATACADLQFPWSPDSVPSSRPATLQAAARTVSPAEIAPFPRSVLDNGLISGCARWPALARRAPDGPLPSVPILLLAGALDTITPLEDARALAAATPTASLVVARDAGHSVIFGGSRCAARALSAFLAQRRVGNPCARTEAPPAAPLDPPSLAALPATRGVGGRAGRTLTAVRASIGDLGRLLGTSQAPRFGGLRGGRASIEPAGTVLRVRLDSFSYVPGVRLTGTLRYRAGGRSPTGRLRVSGTAASRGTVVVTGQALAGRLGGRAVRS